MNTKQLRQKILDLAIRGKLIPQDPNDEPASVLLERVRAEKERLNSRRTKPFVPITESDIPFTVPKGWMWCRLSQIVQVINGDRGKNYPSKEKLSKTGIPFVSASNISNGLVNSEDLLCMTEAQYNLLGNGKLQFDDIVFCIRGSLGKTGFFRFEKGAIASSLVIVRTIFPDSVLRNYVFRYLTSGLLYDEISKYDNGTAQPNLAAKDFENFLIPIPPLAEQSRIVDAVERLSSDVDTIEHMAKSLLGLI